LGKQIAIYTVAGRNKMLERINRDRHLFSTRYLASGIWYPASGIKNLPIF
jgi:hypothetical protein